MAEQDGPPFIPKVPEYPTDPRACNCFGSKPQDFHPPFSHLSDLDLDICEIIALSLIGGAGTLDYNIINYAFEFTKCFQCMTPRQKREYEIWWVLYLTFPTDCTTDSEMQSLINKIKGQHTLEEIKAALTGLRAYSWDYADCTDLP